MKNKVLGLALTIIAAMLWGSSFAVRKIGLSDIGPLMQNGFRFLAGFIFMIIVLGICSTSKKLSEFIQLSKAARSEAHPISVQIKKGILVGLAFACAATCQQLGLVTVAAGTVGFITSLYTVIVPIMLWAAFKIRIRRNVWIGMGLSFIGLYCLAELSGGSNWGYLILLLGACFYATQMVLIGRFIHDCNPFILVTLQLAIGAVVNFILALITSEAFNSQMLFDALGVIIYTGVFSLGVANLLQFISQRIISTSVVAIACSFESVFGLLFSIILTDEVLTIKQSIGCVAIFIAVIVSQSEGGGKQDVIGDDERNSK